MIDDLNILRQMSSDLYTRLCDNAQLKGQYTPHITIGKSKSAKEINRLNKEAQNSLQSDYTATISTIYCKKLIQDSKGNIKLEDEIEFELPQRTSRNNETYN